MRKPSLTTIGFGLIGLGSTLIAAPASAAQNCGTPPTYYQFTSIGDICEISFTEGGQNVNVTVPASATELFALVVGGGAGAQAGFDSGNVDGYGGNAGQVRYLDMSESAGLEIAVVVGSGSQDSIASETPLLAGGNSSAESSAPGQSQTVLALGGSASKNTGAFCTRDNWSFAATFAGFGARALKASENNDQLCDTGGDRGVTPSNADLDSGETATPSIFSNITSTFGTGGRIKQANEELPALKAGDGGGFQVDTGVAGFVNLQNGADGAVYLRWRIGAPLANTGSDSGNLSALAAGLIAAGLAVTVASTARRRAAKKH